jgi:hypothetical protein
MSQSKDDSSSIFDEDKKLKYFGYSFSTVSFLVFVYVLLFPVEKELKQQAIYWFASSFVAAIVPNVKQFKIKDIEVQLQGISEKIEENKQKIEESKNLIEQKNEELRDDVFLGLESVRKHEESLSEEYTLKREQGYQRYANRLKKLSPEERLKEQNKFTIINLIDAGVTIADLKRMLQKAGFYQGEIDEVFNEQLALSISAFQKQYDVTPIDGTVGPKTLSKLSKVIDPV